MLSATEMAVLNGHEMVLTYISRTKRKNRVVSFLLSNMKRSHSILKINKIELIEKEKTLALVSLSPAPLPFSTL
jgi:GTPase Era involved in 16S rRNA processing